MIKNNHRKISLNGKWKLSWLPNSEFTDIDSINHLQAIEVTVPGNFEQDLFKAGIIDDPYFGTNTLKLQDFECMHMIYSCEFIIPDDFDIDNVKLHFDGIDTFADIYLNGEEIGFACNMLIPYVFDSRNLKHGGNTLTVHIKPAEIIAREYELTPSSEGMKYNASSLHVRKAPHMYGWDIMPRIISGGIWRDVYIEEYPINHIKDIFIYTMSIDTDNAKAVLKLNYSAFIKDDSLKEYRLKINGVCGDSGFNIDYDIWHTSNNIVFGVDNCKFWWPRNYGDPDLYDVTVDLMKGDESVDTYRLKTGIRTVKLNRTSTTDADGNGEFCFIVNNKKIFALGTNWVPVDAFHSNDAERLPEILPMLNDLNCNIVRCWGGNVYENKIFYDFCDENGIMIWQDFTMACASYPQDQGFLFRIRNEVQTIVRQLRNHISIILWSGDNECDASINLETNPNDNKITRQVIPEVLNIYDISRPYLPSSPYIDEEAYANKKPISEDHLWGPRDYFKGDFYKNSVCHFASETGYHGCPSPESMRKFISEDKLWSWQNNEEWLAHAACPEIDWKAPYAYRIRLMADQVKTLFINEFDNLDDFSLASQISQAEAKKYFIERFRLTKWRRTGIIWWNLIDGWPQISDAVVDYYYDKKLAYYYIKRSQQPICLMFDEPDENNLLSLYAVNDLQEDHYINYKVTDLTENKVLTESSCYALNNESVKIRDIKIENGEKHFYLIEWNYNGVHGKNHYMTNIINIDFNEYKKYAKSCGFEIKGE